MFDLVPDKIRGSRFMSKTPYCGQGQYVGHPFTYWVQLLRFGRVKYGVMAHGSLHGAPCSMC